jgi:hypothetical protein
MPLAYVVDPMQRLVVITGEYANAEEWTDLLGRVLADPKRGAGFAFLRDLRGATKPVDAAAVVQIMAVVRKFWPQLQPSRAAILTPLDVDAAALVAVAVADTERLPFRVFKAYDEAIQWLRQGDDDGGYD